MTALPRERRSIRRPGTPRALRTVSYAETMRFPYISHFFSPVLSLLVALAGMLFRPGAGCVDTFDIVHELDVRFHVRSPRLNISLIEVTGMQHLREALAESLLDVVSQEMQ